MIVNITSKAFTKPQVNDTFKSLGAHFHLQPLSQSHPVDFNQQASSETSTIKQALHLLDRTPESNLGQCNSLFFEYSRNNRNYEIIRLFVAIRRSCFLVNGSILSCVLKACGCLFDKNIGAQVHDFCVKSGLIEDISVGTALVDMYFKTENVEEGRRAFNGMEERNVVSWTSLLSGYAQNGLNAEALKLFYGMQVEGIKPNAYTYATILGVLADERIVEKGAQVHSMVIKNGFEATVFVCNSLISMYSKSGMVGAARTVFDGMVDRNVVTWNSIVGCFVTNGLYLEAFEMFYRMRLSGVKLTTMTFAPVFRLCADIKQLDFAKQLHCQVTKSGFEFHSNIKMGLMVAYSMCREMEDAFKLFSLMHEVRNVVSWTALVSGYLQNGMAERAVSLFCQMCKDGVIPNEFTYSTILAAQPVVSPFEIHVQTIKLNYEKSPTVGTALLDAYMKLGNADDAWKVFERINERDIVAWSAMIAGYAQIGDTEGAIKTFVQMAGEGTKPNEYTFSSVLNACATPTAAVDQGKQLHAWSIKSKFNNALCVSSALVTMYAKRGNIESAFEVFKRQRERDLVSWNSIISGYAQHGEGRKALEAFKEMQRQNLEIDGVTFIAIISACTHTGLVDEGRRYFDVMVQDHQIEPTMEHYSCMVDLYSRAGMLEKAFDIIKRMPFPAGAGVWRPLLAASRVHCNLELGKLAAEKLISLQPQDSSAYVLLSNMYAAAGNWQERAKIRKLMEVRKVKKEAGYSWIVVKNKSYSFLAGDRSHPMSDQIYLKLEVLSTRLKDAGYQPDTNYVLQDVDEEHKESILSQHSERLAIAFGLIATPPGTPLQIAKNLRVCGDCHTVIKLISMVERRVIVVRDSNRFHHFKEGLCSCGDFW